MEKFVFAYHGSQDPNMSAEEGEALMAAWMGWFGGMGDALVNHGNPVGKSWRVDNTGASEGVADSPLSGYSIVQAENIQAACELAKGCPDVLRGSGWVEVAPLVEIG